MKFRERRRAVIMLMKVGFVVFAISLCSLVLGPGQAPMADLVCTDDSDDQINPIVISTINAHAHAHSKFRLVAALLAPSFDLIRVLPPPFKFVNEFLNPRTLFLSLPTINAP